MCCPCHSLPLIPERIHYCFISTLGAAASKIAASGRQLKQTLRESFRKLKKIRPQISVSTSPSGQPTATATVAPTEGGETKATEGEAKPGEQAGEAPSTATAEAKGRLYTYRFSMVTIVEQRGKASEGYSCCCCSLFLARVSVNQVVKIRPEGAFPFQR